MELHDACAPLAFLLGTWRGTGEGHYPTIEPFRYNEEVTFGHVGKPFLSYSQKTRDSTTGAPLHAEVGYLRAVGDASIELILVQPSGIFESHHGVVVDKVLDLTLASVQTTATAKSVTDVQRTIRVTSDRETDESALEYDVSMAAVGEPLTHHLHARLIRDPHS